MGYILYLIHHVIDLVTLSNDTFSRINRIGERVATLEASLPNIDQLCEQSLSSFDWNEGIRSFWHRTK